jgi:hypothetical protein
MIIGLQPLLKNRFFHGKESEKRNIIAKIHDNPAKTPGSGPCI